ncbi:hypothetical protein ACIOHC_36020 [Streptomyces sp. NPDC088252]|uniref:phage tail fiber protein n=1 Tax=Streptomyces sp. NPDC088252 TaxID=3365845 RepID=UPI003804D301
MTGRSLDLSPVPQTVSLALLTTAPTAGSHATDLTEEAAAAGYFRQSVAFSAATAPVAGQPARIENSGNVLFGPFTASGGLGFPVTHCALIGTGAPVTTANIMPVNTAGSETSTSGWEVLTSNGTQSRSTTQAKAGAASMAVQSTASGDIRIRSTEFFPVQVDHLYKAGIWVYTSVASTPVLVEIEWYDAAGALITTTTGAPTSVAANTWVEVTRNATLRRVNATKAKVAYRITASAAAQTVYCDEMSLLDQKSDEILMTWQFDVAGQAAQNESLQIPAGALSMSLG